MIRTRLVAVVVVLSTLDFGIACLTERDAVRGPPQIEVHVPPVKVVHKCGKRHVDIVEGRVPDDAVEIVRGSTVGKEPHLSLRAHEEAAKERASSLCADGISVLSATESPAGVANAVVAFWRKKTAHELAALADARSDGGVAVVDAGERPFDDDDRGAQ